MLVATMFMPTLGVAQPAPSAPGPAPTTSPQPPPPVVPGRPDQLSQPIPFTSRLVPGPDYRLGAGDLLEVQVVGRVEVNRQTVTVDLDGTISIPPLGILEIGGLTLPEAHRKIVERARAVFKFAEVSVSILAPRLFDVVVAGEVEHPGSVLVSATRRLHEALQAAGGVTARGSLRRIQVTDASGEHEYDLLRFELTGDVSQNPFVHEGMRIHVPTRGSSVMLSGAFARPGEYEITTPGSLDALLALTGGLAQNAAATDARLTRVGEGGRKQTTALDLTGVVARGADVPLRRGDVVFVPTLGVLQDVVEIRGAFNGTPESTKTTTAGKATVLQRLELARGERVQDVVLKAGGAAPYADLRMASVERRSPEGPSQRIPIDLYRLLVEKDATQNLALENGDVITLPVLEDRVFVVGEVKTPGPLDFRTDLTPREYVALAGGPTNRAKLANTTVTFRNGRTYAMADAPPLEPGAVVTVPEVAVKWWQDYVLIAQAIGSLITAYTGIFVLFNGPIRN